MKEFIDDCKSAIAWIKSAFPKVMKGLWAHIVSLVPIIAPFYVLIRIDAGGIDEKYRLPTGIILLVYVIGLMGIQFTNRPKRYLKGKFNWVIAFWREFLSSLLPALAKVMKTAWLYLAGLLAVSGLYFLLTRLEQGIDVLIQAGEHPRPAFISVFAVFSGAMFIWYSGRLLSYVKQQCEYIIYGGTKNSGTPEAYIKSAIPTSYHRHVPRLIAFNLFVVVQIAIFKLPNIGPDSGLFTFLMFFGHNVAYFVFTKWLVGKKEWLEGMRASKRKKEPDPAKGLEQDWSQKNENEVAPVAALQQKRIGWRDWLRPRFLIIVLGAYLLVILGRFVFSMSRIDDLSSSPLRYTCWLMLVAAVIFLLQWLGLFLVIWRRRTFGKRSLPFDSGWFEKFLNWIQVNPKHIGKEVADFGYFLIPSVIALSFYFLTMSKIAFAGVIGPLAFATLAVAILTSTANLISAFSVRWSVNFFVILILVSFLVGLFNDPYIVRATPTADKKKAHDLRPDVATYLHGWFEAPIRRRLIDEAAKSKTKFPIYIVLSNGGASRAGSWTTRVLSHLQDKSFQADSSNQFADHIICLAGASGGTVGNSAFYSLLRARQLGVIKPDDFSNRTNEFFRTDFLTYTLAHLVGPDLFRHVMPLWIGREDRAAALEDVMTFGPGDTTVSRYFHWPMSQVFDTTCELPIYFINTTQVDNGMPGVISSVKLGPEWLRSDVLSLVDRTGPDNEGLNIRLSTASVLSSRFPYVSPAGKVLDRYFVDGGYFDNSGAGTVYELMQDLSAFFEKDSVLYSKISLNILQITNSEQLLKPTGDIHPLTNDLAAPLLTLAGMQGASTKIGTGILKTYFKKNFNSDSSGYIIYSLYDPGWKMKGVDDYEEGYPMSWVISDYQFDRTEKALKRENRQHLAKFYFSRGGQ